MNIHFNYYRITKYITTGLLSVTLLFFLSLSFAKTIELTFENYTEKSLDYIEQNETQGGALTLPASVPAVQPDNLPSTVNAYVQLDQDVDTASGTFRIGYNQQHFCEFHYSLEKQTV